MFSLPILFLEEALKFVGRRLEQDSSKSKMEKMF